MKKQKKSFLMKVYINLKKKRKVKKKKKLKEIKITKYIVE